MLALAKLPSRPIKSGTMQQISTVAKLKPASAKGAYFKSITISTTMSPGITIETNSIAGI
jgi:large subunit ribosomal protein L1